MNICSVPYGEQPANILLDSGMNARLGDAGIARVLDTAEGDAASTQVQGTLNYMDPGYMRTGTLNDKSDIYRYLLSVFQLCHT